MEMYNRKWIKEGAEVAEKDNLGHKMIVSRILKKTKKVASYKRNPDGTVKYDNKTVMEGVECYWWEEGKMCKERFHTRRLVPWEVAEKGQKAVIEFIESI